MGLVDTNLLTGTNHDNSILPSVIPSLLQVHEQILPKEDPKRVPCEHRPEGLIEFLSKDSNLIKNDEGSTKGREVNKLPWVERCLVKKGETSNPMSSMKELPNKEASKEKREGPSLLVQVDAWEGKLL